jgi:hypothetical protein
LQKIYIVTFKEGNLPTIWEETRELQVYQTENHHHEVIMRPDGNTEERHYHWVTGMDYHGYRLNWLECQETITKNKGSKEVEEAQCTFTHITDLPIGTSNIILTSRTGRLRWKIENEGFNTLKNGGYEMEHKYSRVNYQASKNYYQLMQMAYLINQLIGLANFPVAYCGLKIITSLSLRFPDFQRGKKHENCKSTRQKITIMK